MGESGNSTKAGLIIALQTQDLNSFTHILTTTSLDLNKFVDPGGYNIFHDFAKTLIKEYLMVPYLQALLSEFKVRHTPNVLTEMLNSLTIKEKQSPLHLAAKHNKIKLVMEFLRLGADPRLKDAFGQTVLHIAAFTGNVGIFVFFYCTLSLDPYEKDSSNNSPLHLSVAEGQENMSLFLISISKDLNIPDSKGYTPLHLTAISYNYKIARNLVMRGAKRKLRCLLGQTPEELARSRGCTDMLKVLKQPPIVGNPCKPPLEKHSKKRFYSFIVFLIIKALVVGYLVLPKFDVVINAIILGITILGLIMFIIISFKNPEYVNEKTTIAELYATIKPEFICPYCKGKKLHLTIHCHFCNKCVKKYDHHCPWINNCIGAGNQALFFIFLVILFLDLAVNVVLGVFYFLSFEEKNAFYIVHPEYANKYIGLGVTIVCFVIIVSILPIIYLQSCNLMNNQTTRQRLAVKRNGVYSSLSSTSSILIKDSEDWSYFTKKSEDLEIEEEKGCCGRKKELPSISQSSNINEETD